MNPFELFSALLVGCCLIACDAQAAAERPHILLIVADDLGWNDVGYHGSEIRTPRIDGLAASGVRSEQFYVLPTCTPSRAALLTGRHPIRYGLQRDVIRPWHRHGLDLGERTLAELFQGAGYFTVLIGKWHLGMAEPAHLPTRRGFSHHYGLYGGMVDYFQHTRFKGLDWHRNGSPLRERGYSTDLLAAEAVSLVQAHDPSQPILMVLSFNAPHTPLQAPRSDIRAYSDIRDPRRRVYAAMVSRMDGAIGDVLDAFQARGMLEKTLILFVSDNGGDPEEGASNTPLRGGKRSLSEGGVRVPAVWRWPGSLPADRQTDVPMHAVDVIPTLLSAAGIPVPEAASLDGADLLPALRGGAAPEREILLNLTEGEAALRVGRWKLIVTGSLDRPDSTALYDLVADPVERQDRSAEDPARVRDLLARLMHYRESAVPALSLSSEPPEGYKPESIWGASAEAR